MRIFINGKPYNFSKELTIEQVIIELNIQQKQGIAVAVNQTVLSKSLFSQTFIKEGDKLEIIHATAGG